MFFSIILLTFLQILHSKIPSPGKLVKTRHIWRHDLQSESTGSRRSERIGDSCSRYERVDNSTSSWVELCRYKRPLSNNNKRLRSRYCTVAVNCWRAQSIARPLCNSRATCPLYQVLSIARLGTSPEEDKFSLTSFFFNETWRNRHLCYCKQTPFYRASAYWRAILI